MTSLSVLLLAVCPATRANTIADHVESFRRHSRHRIVVAQNYRALVGPALGFGQAIGKHWPLNDFDAVVVHYSNYLAHPASFDDASKERLAAYRGLKVLFIQDEYRTVDATVEIMARIGFDVVFTCVPEEEVDKVYPDSRLPGLRRVSNLTGFVPESLLDYPAPPVASRPIDVGYRARQLPLWMGELAAEKWQIVPGFLQATRGAGLRCDVSSREEDRLYGDAWTKFIASCRTVLGVESGASVFDFSGSIQRDVDEYVATHPDATFADVQGRFLLPHEHKVRLNQISPRCFEAAALRTPMVLFEGNYSGILQPSRHYIALRKDFSNIGEVIAAIKDVEFLQQMADRTYREIARNDAYSYASFVHRFDDVIATEWKTRIGAKGIGAKPPMARLPTWRLFLLACSEPARLVYFAVHRVLAPFAPLIKRLPDPTRNRLRGLRRWIFGDLG